MSHTSDIFFLLGQTTELCLAELEVVAERFGVAKPSMVFGHWAKIPAMDLAKVPAFMETLGGTQKIAEFLEAVPHAKDAELREHLRRHFLQLQAKRIVIAEHGRDHLPEVDVVDLKHELTKDGLHVSYHETPRYGANAAVINNRKVTEVHVIQTADSLILARTLAAHDIDSWTERDIDKPSRDRKRGMLSPKVSRMLLNLGMGSGQPQDHRILDPFCGTGTILLEATAMGVPEVYGNDIDPRAIASTNANLEWWKQTSKLSFRSTITIAPTEKLEKRHFPNSPTAIVTEPFLGKLTPLPIQIPGVIRGLEKLYRGTIHAFARLLEPGARVVFILPAFQSGSGRSIELHSTLKDFQKAGFRQLYGPMRAGRPSAVTQRHVYVLEYDPYGTR